MMTKGGAVIGVECTMCGDHGLQNHLFKCTVCNFRSQHEYCSDLYPKADTYGVCNWCLREKEGKAWREEMEGRYVSTAMKRSLFQSVDLQRSFPAMFNPIKKLRSSDSTTDKSVEKISSKQKHYTVVRKTNLGCTGISRQSFRGKARRYKLLEEVSS